MDKAALQNYCLQIMGITQWQRRDNQPTSLPHLVLLDEATLSYEEEQLLGRMLQALGWPAATQRKFGFDKLEVIPRKILVFGEKLKKITASYPTAIMAVVPSLKVLLKDKNAKKQAWEAMQVLIEK